MSRRLEWVKDDGGRKAAGFRGSKDMAKDCVMRAIAIATGEPYAKVHEELTWEAEKWRGRRTHGTYGIPNNVVHAAIEKKRKWKWHPAPKGKAEQINLRPGEIPMKGTVIVSLKGHLVTVRDGVMHDTWNPDRGGYAKVLGYWTKRGV